MIDECTSQRCCIIFFFTPSLCGVRGTSFEMHSKLKSETTNLANPNNQQQNLCENNNMASFIAAIQLGTPQTFRHEIKRKCMKFFRQIFILIFMFSYVCVCALSAFDCILHRFIAEWVERFSELSHTSFFACNL